MHCRLWQIPAYMKPIHSPFQWQQRATLVNVKIKWVKDRALDSVVARERHLRLAHHLLDLLSSDPRGHIPSYELYKLSPKFGLNILVFLRRYPTLFHRGMRCFSATDAALGVRRREFDVRKSTEPELIDRLCRLLMITLPRSIPLHTIDLLSWDLGLPKDYRVSLLPRYQHLFELVQPHGDERVWLRLLKWDDRLAVSELEKASFGQTGGDTQNLAFPVSFTRGFGLKKKFMDWLKEWQTLPYTSPYADASSLDPRTDVSEKRSVGVFHELLHLTVAKKTERRNLSNMRKLLGLPQKFTKVFERHPGIFYLSEKLATQTVVLREAYGGGTQLLTKHPLVAVREEYSAMMLEALPTRRRKNVLGAGDMDEQMQDFNTA